MLHSWKKVGIFRRSITKQFQNQESVASNSEVHTNDMLTSATVRN
jgi:hypothetical protein